MNMETFESYCTQCLVDFGAASLGCTVTIVAQDDCISCETFGVIEGEQNESTVTESCSLSSI